MVPAYLEELAEIPMTTGGKVDRKSLPPPSGQRRQATRGAYPAPAAGTESVLADTLAACSAWTGSRLTPTSSTSSVPAPC